MLKNQITDRAAIYVIATNAGQAAAGLITAIFIVRYFSPAIQGYYNTFANLLALEIFLELGLSGAITAFAAHEWAKQSLDRQGASQGTPHALSRLKSLTHDAVFDGSRPWNKEEDPVSPILTYGRRKLAIERFLASQEMPWLAVRLPMLVAEDGDRRCMVSGWVDAFVSEGENRCATDQFFTPAAASDAAAAIGDLLRRSALGRTSAVACLRGQVP